MNRWLLAAGLCGIAVVMTGVSVWMDGVASLKELLPNMAAEIVGLAMTVALVDWLIERSRLADEAQRMAWAMLHEIDHVVWVWQGGRREFHLDEMFALLEMVKEDDQMTESTQELISNLGIRASDNLRLQPRIMRRHTKLRTAMKSLSGLAQIREIKRLVNARYTVDSMQTAIKLLSDLTEQEIHLGQFGAAKGLRDASPEGQMRRFLGERGAIMASRSASESSRAPSSQYAGSAPDSRVP